MFQLFLVLAAIRVVKGAAAGFRSVAPRLPIGRVLFSTLIEGAALPGDSWDEMYPAEGPLGVNVHGALGS